MVTTHGSAESNCTYRRPFPARLAGSAQTGSLCALVREGVVPTGAKCGLIAHTFRREEVGTQRFSHFLKQSVYIHC